MIVDYTQPMELDDGTPVEFVEYIDHEYVDNNSETDWICVSFDGSAYHNGKYSQAGNTYDYDAETGFNGGDDSPVFKRLRNVIVDSFEPDLDL